MTGKQQGVRATVSAWVRNKRKARGWSQYELGKESGLGRGAIAQYEQGRRTPGQRNMERLLDAFEFKGEEKRAAMGWARDNLRWK